MTGPASSHPTTWNDWVAVGAWICWRLSGVVVFVGYMTKAAGLEWVGLGLLAAAWGMFVILMLPGQVTLPERTVNRRVRLGVSVIFGTLAGVLLTLLLFVLAGARYGFVAGDRGESVAGAIAHAGHFAALMAIASVTVASVARKFWDRPTDRHVAAPPAPQDP